MGVAGEQNAELEHNFLQLAYAVWRLRSATVEAVGYFAVLRQEVRDAVQHLRLRYDVGDSVHIVFTSLLVSDMTRLAEAAEMASTQGDSSILTSVARQIVGEALRREISECEPGAVECATQDALPYGVRWDYYGEVHSSDGRRMEGTSSTPRLI